MKERQPPARAEDTAAPGLFCRLLGLVCLVCLLAWQCWMTLSLFGREQPWERLLDGQPVFSGEHPLHLYHGYLGSQSLAETGSLCCFDPAFQGGYPKTPIFDAGSRPAELFLSLAGGGYRPEAYKVGLAACCAAVPLLLFLAARGAGLGRVASHLTTALGLLVWWGTPGRRALEFGDLDLLLGSVAALFQAGMLLRLHRGPALLPWGGLLLGGGLCWFTQPMLSVLLLPLVLVYYFSTGPRHQLAWHIALVAVLGAGIIANAFWLEDWVSHWWIRAPLQLGVRRLTHRTLQAVWSAPLWGDPADRALAITLAAAAVAGACSLYAARQRVAARLLAMGMLEFLALTLLCVSWEPMGRVGTPQLLLPGLFFAVPLAAHGLCRMFVVPQHAVGRWYGLALTGCILGAAGFGAHEHVQCWVERCHSATPLAVGLGPEREALVADLAANTTADARILWEDRPGEQRWTVLLPILTGRPLLGGLDPEAAIEHGYATLKADSLAGRPLAAWTDDELQRFCRRYNVGWVVCWSAAARQRFEAWSAATRTTTLRDRGEGWLFAVHRPRSFILKGKARWLHADAQRIALGDLVPDADGTVVLSLHYQAGMVASPGRVRVEREVDPYDPIPFVRLSVPGPVARVTLTWENH